MDVVVSFSGLKEKELSDIQSNIFKFLEVSLYMPHGKKYILEA